MLTDTFPAAPARKTSSARKTPKMTRVVSYFGCSGCPFAVQISLCPLFVSKYRIEFRVDFHRPEDSAEIVIWQRDRKGDFVTDGPSIVRPDIHAFLVAFASEVGMLRDYDSASLSGLETPEERADAMFRRSFNVHTGIGPLAPFLDYLLESEMESDPGSLLCELLGSAISGKDVPKASLFGKRRAYRLATGKPR